MFRFRLFSLSKYAIRSFLEVIGTLSSFAKDRQLAKKAAELAGNKIEGVARKEYAAAQKDLAEAERIRMDLALQEKLHKILILKETAEARITIAKAFEAELELVKKLKEAGVIPQISPDGVMTLLPFPSDLELEYPKLVFLHAAAKFTHNDPIENQTASESQLPR